MIKDNQTLRLQQNVNNSEQVKIFLRMNNSKKGTDFISHSQITESHLVKLIQSIILQNKFLQSTCTNTIQKLQYFIQGHQINPQNSQIIKLRQSSIIHVLNYPENSQQKIHVTFRYENPEESIDITQSLQVNISQTIQQVTFQVIPLNFSKFLNQITFIYLGAEVLPQNTFKQVNIQNGCQIIVIDKLKTLDENIDPFENAEQISPQTFGFKPRKIQIQPKDSLEVMGLNMPYNPTIQAYKVKQILEQNIIVNQLQQEQNLLNEQNQSQGAAPHNLLSHQQNVQEQNLIISAEQIQQKMDEQKNIPTKQQIEEQKSSKQIQQ